MQTNSNLKVYRASAGSGKTYTLAVEYIAHLIGGKQWDAGKRHHRHILAITFTNKATAEMKERILQFLQKLSLGTDEQLAQKVVETGDIPKEELQQRAQAAMEAIIHDYSHFHIHTIDTFFQRLLSSLAHELGQSASFRVDINDKEVTSEAVDTLLRQLDDNADVREWVRQYIQRRVGEAKNWRLAEDIKRFAEKNVLSEEFQSTSKNMQTFTSDTEEMKNFQNRLYMLRQKALNTLAGLKDNLQNAEEAIASVGEECFQRKGALATGFIRKVADATDLSAPKKTVREYMENPEKLLLKAHVNDPEALRAAETISRELSEANKTLEKCSYIINSCNLTLRNLNPLRLLGEISNTIEQINTEHNRMLLAQTKLLFREMVTGDDAPFIFEKAGTQYSNILIDEFQDTARTQWENLRKLLLEKAATGDDCLIVGDIKQSIYRWNGGDWRILKNIQDYFSQKVNSFPLEENFRSQAAIVRFNNKLFPLAAKVLDELGENADEKGENRNENENDSESESVGAIYSDVAQRYQPKNTGGFVRVTIDASKENDFGPLTTEGTKEDSPDATVAAGSHTDMQHTMAAQIKRLHDECGVPWDQMAILVRKKDETQRILDNFSHFHREIPLISDEAFYLSSSPAVMLLVNALRHLTNGRDDVSRTYMLRIYRNVVLGEARSAEELTGNEVDGLLPEGFVSGRETLRTMPLYALCLRLCEMFGLNELCKREDMRSQAAFLTSFLDEVVDFLSDNPPSIELFLRHWDERLVERAIPSAEASGVRILTIHKSKGLAFDTVFVPFCQWELEDLSNASRNIEWWKPKDEEYAGPPLVPVTPIAAAANSTYADEYAAELFQRRIDNLNLAYVAFTRPKTNLLIWAAVKPKKGEARISTIGDVLNNTLDALCGELQDFDEAESARDIKTAISSEGDCLVLESGTRTSSKAEVRQEESLPLTFSPRKIRATFVQSSDAGLFVGSSDQTEENVAHGLLYHRIFEDFETAADIDEAISRLRNAGIIPHTLADKKLSAYAHARIDGKKAQPIVREWFDGSWEVHREATLLTRTESGKLKTLRPDRVMERTTEGKLETVVVDYKFARPDEEHVRQVRRYMEALREMGRTDVKGFLWYVDTNQTKYVGWIDD
ncbi:MAG: UvrD-helicase domain-containing protein [Alloprevotella sp.]|nr:UvrD-helicase domain-containing protein [Alloprevotella sp.]